MNLRPIRSLPFTPVQNVVYAVERAMEHVGRAARAARALVEGLVRGKGGGKATQPWSFERVASLLFGACCLLAYACGPGALWASNSDLIGEYPDLKIASVTER